MNDNIATLTLDIDQEVYDQIEPLFKSLGTTIEDMTAAFIQFCVIPENKVILKTYLGIDNVEIEAEKKIELHHRVFNQVFDIATKNTGQFINDTKPGASEPTNL